MIVVTVPTVIVFHTAMLPIPVAGVKAFAVMTWSYPTSSDICGTRPVTIMTAVAATYWVPIASDPCIIGARTARLNPDNALRRRRSDPHSNRYLSENNSRTQQGQQQ